MNSKLILATFLFATFQCNLISGVSHAQEQNVNLSKVTCRELLLMNGEDAGFTMVFYHGYMSGKRGDKSFDPEAYAKSTDNIRKSCIDNPGMPLMKVFDRYR